MSDRKNVIGDLIPGDIFCAEISSGANLICLVTAVQETLIQARTVTSQISLCFDRRSGVGTWGAKFQCKIRLMDRFPLNIKKILLQIDKKYQEDQKSNYQRTDISMILSNEEKMALLFFVDFIKNMEI